jgi:uncharacterized protein (UPF0335 family)
MNEVPTNGSADLRLKSFIERAERINVDRENVAADFTELMKEAKGAGFDTKIIRQVIRLRKMPKADRQEREELLQTYMAAAGEA